MNAIEWLCVHPDTPLFEILRRQAGASELGLPAGIVLVLDDSGKIKGTVTDGDIRRAVLDAGHLNIYAHQIMNHLPIIFSETQTFQEILQLLPHELEKRGRRSRRFLGKIVLVDSEGKPTRILDYHQLWEQRVAIHRHVVIIGVGYAGLTLALKLAQRGIHVSGFDIDEQKISLLKDRRSYVREAGIDELLQETLDRNFFVSSSIPADGDVFVITVETPIIEGPSSERKVPNLKMLLQATEVVGKNLKAGSLVVIRSTVPVGTTRSQVLPVLERTSGLKGGVDFHLSYAPERTVEGNALHELGALPQMIGGINEDSVEATAALFREITSNIVRVASLEAGELAKLINNSFRDLTFAFANELIGVASMYNLDLVECIKAANQSYPRDIVPVPSPGVGGPCLTKDPYILASSFPKSEYGRTLSEYGRQVNESMGQFVVDSVLFQLNQAGKDPKLCDVLICGFAFKGQPEISDLRSSSSVEIAGLLKKHVRSISVHDPVVEKDKIVQTGYPAVDLPPGFEGKDAVLFLNNHSSYAKINLLKVIRMMREPAIIYDAWRVFRPEDILNHGSCIYMGLGFAYSSLKPAHGENKSIELLSR